MKAFKMPDLKKHFKPMIYLCAVVGFAGVGMAFLLSSDDAIIAAAVQSDGAIIIADKFSPGYIRKLSARGIGDQTFSQSWAMGGFNRPALALAVQRDDKIIVGGEFTSFDTSIAEHIARLNSDGTLDVAFAAKVGTGFDDNVTSVLLQADGKLIVIGDFSSYDGHSAPGIVRLNADGELDSSFTVASGVISKNRRILAATLSGVPSPSQTNVSGASRSDESPAQVPSEKLTIGGVNTADGAGFSLTF